MEPRCGHRRRLDRPTIRASDAILVLPLLRLAFLTHSVQAWVPPKPLPGLEPWEPVQAMRERLGIQFNYTPSLIHPEICRYMTEEECRRGDQNLKIHAKAHRGLAEERRHNPNLGTFKVLVLLIVFSDHTNRPLVDKGDVEFMWNTLVPEWFDVNSYGNYDIEPVVAEWVITDNTEQYYSFGKSGFTPDFQKAAWPALNALDQKPGWDWSLFDMDDDNKLDSVVITHSGFGAESRLVDEYGRDYPDRIWAHAFAESTDTWTSKDGKVSLNGYTVASAFEDAQGTRPATIGLTVHEYMHTFDIIDLYDVTFVGKGISGFDIMANPYGIGDPNLPGHLSTWTKMEAEWVTPKVITENGIYTLQPMETTSECYQIVLQEEVAEGKKEHLLLENRQKLEHDVNLYGAGLAIYHIDDSKDGQNGGGWPAKSGWPENNEHYRVAMLQADGKYGMEQGQDGDAADLWQPGQELGPGKSKTVFPNTDKYANGLISETGITIKVLESDGLTVKFEVTGLVPPAGGSVASETSQPTTSPSGQPSVLPSNIPTQAATGPPSQMPSELPSETPSQILTLPPTVFPGQPTQQPSHMPSSRPSATPTTLPTMSPSRLPSAAPSETLSLAPTKVPPGRANANVTQRPVTRSPVLSTGPSALSPPGPVLSTGPSALFAPVDDVNPDLFQPEEDNGVVATDSDNSPTKAPFFVAIDMTAQDQAGKWTHSNLLPASSETTSSDVPASCPNVGSIGLLIFLTLLQFN